MVPLVLQGGNSGVATEAPSPRKPAQSVTVTGAQDSPIFQGAKPQEVPPPVVTQPKKKARRPWWEADWERIAAARAKTRVKLDTVRQDVGRGIPITAVTGMGYSDVVGVDFTQPSIQGRQHKAQVSDRTGAGLIHRYVTRSWALFPRPRLKESSTTATRVPYVPRNVTDPTQVPPGFQQNGAPLVEHANVLPLIR